MRFEAWVNERLTTDKAAMAAAQEKILSLENEVDDLHAHDAVQSTAVYEITEELGQARVRIDAQTRENQALRAKLAAGPADVPRGAGMATFMMSTSPERENADLEGAYGFNEAPVEIPVTKTNPEKTLKGKHDALGGDPPPSPSSSSSSTSSSSWRRGRSNGRRGRSEKRKKEKKDKFPHTRRRLTPSRCRRCRRTLCNFRPGRRLCATRLWLHLDAAARHSYGCWTLKR